MKKKLSLPERLLPGYRQHDAERIDHETSTLAILPYIYSSRQAASVFTRQSCNITETLRYIENYNNAGGDHKLSLFGVLIAALLCTGIHHPALNRYILGKRVYQGKKLRASFTVKQDMSRAGKEMVAKVTGRPEDALQDITGRVDRVIRKIRMQDNAGKGDLIEGVLRLPSFVLRIVFRLEKFLHNWGVLPRRLMDSDPLYSSIFIANLGSLGLGPVYHPLYERGTVSVFVVLSKQRTENGIGADGSIVSHNMLDLSFTVDSRITDGYSLAEGLRYLKALLEDPRLLERQFANQDRPVV